MLKKHPYIRKTLNVSMSILLGVAILYWMYRDFDFRMVEHTLLHEMNWWWMLASFPFCVIAQAFRGLRWKQLLEPLGEKPSTATSIRSIYVSYAASLLVPRVGEFTRCGVLAKKDGVSFPKALGTVVTERVIDSLIILLIVMLVILMQLPVFLRFFSKTGTRLDDITQVLSQFSSTGYLVIALCLLATLLGAYIFRKKLAFYDRVKATVHGVLSGVMSVRSVSNVPLFLFYSFGIWVAYFLHFYVTFFCFEATSGLSLTCVIVCFIVGCVAVVVPTPNGAGPWHFAVKTMLILYGLGDANALMFVIIVHSVQTLMVALLGIYGLLKLQ
ncbi:MAG: flippase-like domain-containing protein [Prevotella sp.]|nr:flippase-like domain-containing protein [Prevotella sp.]